MTRPWALIAASGVTAGALAGPVGAMVFAMLVTIAVSIAGQRPIAVGVVVLVFALLGAARVDQHQPLAIDGNVLASVQGEGTIVSIPRTGASGPRALMQVERVRHDDGEWIGATGKVLVLFGETATGGVDHGDRVRLRWTVAEAGRFDPDFRRFILSENAGGLAHSFDTTILSRGQSSTNALVRLRNLVTDRIEGAIEGDGGALLAGFVTGDDSGLSDEARNAFELTNTSHITAVSGSNVAILISMWFVILPTRRMQRLFVTQALLLALIWSYVVLVGLGPGAIRAGLFATLMLPAARFGRKADPMTSLMLASAVMLMVTPGWALNVGFWLSMAASAAMVTSLSLSRQSSSAFTLQALIALTAAQVATFPITFWIFDGWSPASLIANLMIGPLVAMLFPVAFVVAGVVTLLPWMGEILGWLPKLGANVIISIVESLAGEFPMLRSGSMTAPSVMLIAALSAVLLAGISTDARRWVTRIGFRHREHAPYLPPLLLGLSIGVWIVSLVFATMR